MTMTTRRGVLGALAVSGATLAANRLEAAPNMLDFGKMKKDTEVACLYHCDYGDARRFSAMLRNINNHLSVYDFDTLRLKLVIVAHSAGVKFFMKDLAGTPWEKDKIDPEIYKRFVGLAKFGVEAYLCQITFKRQNIDLSKVHEAPYIKIVPSGVGTVAELQGKGFAYLKVG